MKLEDASFSLPQHGGYIVSKELGGLFLYGSMDEKHATPALIKVLAQKDHPGREIAVLLLWLQATPEARAALKALDRKTLSAKLQKNLDDNMAAKPLQPREKT